MRDSLLERKSSGRLDRVDEWIHLVAINRLTGHSSGFFSVYTLPPNQALAIESQRKINESRKQTPPLRDVVSVVDYTLKYSWDLGSLAQALKISVGDVQIYFRDASTKTGASAQRR